MYFEHLLCFVFMQISDLHLSKFRDYGQAEDLQTFCKTTLKTINPEFVIVTGNDKLRERSHEVLNSIVTRLVTQERLKPIFY